MRDEEESMGIDGLPEMLAFAPERDPAPYMNAEGSVRFPLDGPML